MKTKKQKKEKKSKGTALVELKHNFDKHPLIHHNIGRAIMLIDAALIMQMEHDGHVKHGMEVSAGTNLDTRDELLGTACDMLDLANSMIRATIMPPLNPTLVP